jgi:hypothetical protein
MWEGTAKLSITDCTIALLGKIEKTTFQEESNELTAHYFGVVLDL